MLHQFLALSVVRFWRPENFEYPANPNLGNLKHLQNHGHLLLTAPCVRSLGTTSDHPIRLGLVACNNMSVVR